MFDWLKRWLKDVPTTALIIVSGVVLSALYVLWALAADSLGRPLNELTLNTLGMFLMGMLVGGVAQFGVKRFSDDRALAAKHGTPMPEPRPSREVEQQP